MRMSGMHLITGGMAAHSRRPRILIVVAVPMTVKAFLLHYISTLAECYDVTIACSDEAFELEKLLPAHVHYRPVDIARKMSPLADLVSLIKLVVLIRQGGFSLVHSVTPKAGLLSQLAAWVNRVPVRVHTFTGQVWVTRKGLGRRILKAVDCLMASCATDLLADSESQRQFLIANRVVATEKIRVLGNGSIAGVDSERFRPDPDLRREVRRALGCDDAQTLGLFLGRLSREKGVLDLVSAFNQVATHFPRSTLLLVGPDEEGLAQELEALAGANGQVRLLGPTNAPERFMAAADFFCLPSYREGFGTVVIEAAACGLPAMVSEIYGLTDAVENEVSGVFHPPRDVGAIATLFSRYLGDPVWRSQLGTQARERALTLFSASTVAKIQLAYVAGLLRDHGIDEQTVS